MRGGQVRRCARYDWVYVDLKAAFNGYGIVFYAMIIITQR